MQVQVQPCIVCVCVIMRCLSKAVKNLWEAISVVYMHGLYLYWSSIPSKVQNLRKMRNFEQNFSIFAHRYNDLKAN